MRAFIAFTKKECLEMLRTYKLFIMGAVFLLLGIMNPLTAKMTPMLMESFLPEGVEMSMGEPTAMDSWAQFFKNVPQLGLVVMIIVFSGILSNELSKGTLINMVTKGLSRTTVILAKFTIAVLTWSLAYWMCFGISYAYTRYFWPQQPEHLGFAVFCVWWFGIFLLSILMLGSAMISSNYGALLFTGLFWVVLLVGSFFKKIADYNPLQLASQNTALLAGQIKISDLSIPLFINSGCILLFLTISVIIFRKKQL